MPNDASLRKHLKRHECHLIYEMTIGFMLFAALAAREDYLKSQKVASLSVSQAKTAQMFSKA